MIRLGKQPPRYRFFLNPYAHERFDVCPQCDGPTEVRKYPLLLHVEPKFFFCLGKTCRYCPRCDLVIAHQHEIERELAFHLQKHQPHLVGNNYLAIGTVEVEAWERGRQTPLSNQEMTDNLHDFEKVLTFEPVDATRPTRQRERPPMPRLVPRHPGILPVSADAGRKPGRNDRCWCGSGKKYKNCHLRQDTP